MLDNFRRKEPKSTARAACVFGTFLFLPMRTRAGVQQQRTSGSNEWEYIDRKLSTFRAHFST